MRNFYPKFVLFFLVTPIFISPFVIVEKSIGQGSLQVFPTRIVFEGRTRSEKVTLINRGTKSAKYRITFKNMRMTPDGGYESINDTKDALPGEKFADSLIRYSPRQIEIAPGTSQVVRLLLRKKSNLPSGEYRSHMMFSALPPESAGKNIEVLGSGKKGLKIKLTPIFGVTIPIIVRHGSTSAIAKFGTIKIQKPKKPDDEYKLSIPINREGNQSLYGNLFVEFTPENGGNTLEVGRLNGLAVYTPNKIRITTLTLHPPPGVELKRGLLKVTYKAESEFLIEKSLKLP